MPLFLIFFLSFITSMNPLSCMFGSCMKDSLDSSLSVTEVCQCLRDQHSWLVPYLTYFFTPRKEVSIGIRTHGFKEWGERFPLAAMKHLVYPVYPSSVVNCLHGQQLPENMEPSGHHDCGEKTNSHCIFPCTSNQIYSKSCICLWRNWSRMVRNTVDKT